MHSQGLGLTTVILVADSKMAFLDERANLLASHLLIAVLRQRRETEATRKHRYWIYEILKKARRACAKASTEQDNFASWRNFVIW